VEKAGRALSALERRQLAPSRAHMRGGETKGGIEKEIKAKAYGREDCLLRFGVFPKISVHRCTWPRCWLLGRAMYSSAKMEASAPAPLPHTGEHLAACADRQPSHDARGAVLSFSLPKNVFGLIHC
jgi:hypothetical protein